MFIPFKVGYFLFFLQHFKIRLLVLIFKPISGLENLQLV